MHKISDILTFFFFWGEGSQIFTAKKAKVSDFIHYISYGSQVKQDSCLSVSLPRIYFWVFLSNHKFISSSVLAFCDGNLNQNMGNLNTIQAGKGYVKWNFLFVNKGDYWYILALQKKIKVQEKTISGFFQQPSSWRNKDSRGG